MATRRKRRKNSAVRMGGDFDSAIINPENEEVQITISAPKGSTLGSDIAMLAAKEGIGNTRGNPRRKRKRTTKMATKMFGNPIHYPKTRAKSGTHKFVGRPAAEKWWILDLMDRGGRKIKTEIGKGSKKKAETEAIGFIDHRVKTRSKGNKTVKSAMLSGPYARKPTARTARK